MCHIHIIVGVTKVKLCVLGLGEVGLPTAKYVTGKDLEVWGYDIDVTVTSNAKKHGFLTSTSQWQEIPPADVYLICVSTMLKRGIPDLSSVFDVCKKINNKANSTSLVSIESTVTPGTCRKIYKNIFRKRLRLVHVPHRYWAEDPINHGVRQLRVIGAINPESLRAGLNFYEDILDIRVHVVSSIEVAEMSKIAENASRYLQIAFAEELRMICEELGLTFEEARSACNTKWNAQILEARDGIKGHCIPKDIKYLASMTKYNALLKSALSVDEAYRSWLSRRS